jgi:hypothetical protein
MNFHYMDAALNHSDAYLWEIAIPVAFVTVIWLMKDTIKWYLNRHLQKRFVSNSRKGRLSREAAAKNGRR